MAPKVKLSSEEKLKLKQENKLAKKVAVVEANRQFKRDELTRELKHGEHTRRKMEHKWKDMLLNIKLPVLKNEFQLAISNTEIMLDMKDFIISLLLDELDVAETQYAFNLQAHCDKMAKIYRTYLMRLNDLKQDYEEELTLCCKEMKLEQADLEEKFDKEENTLKTMIFGIACGEKKLSTMGHSMYLSKKKEMDHKFTEEITVKRNEDEMIFDKIWRKFIEYLENYNQQIKDVRKDFKKRYEKNILVDNINEKQRMDIHFNYNALKIIKEKQEIEKEKLNDIIENLIEERNHFTKIFLQLKKMYQEDLRIDEKMLTYLVVESNQQIKILESFVKLAEKLLKMYSIVRKLETRREKILPLTKVKKPKAENWHVLTNFWQKCAKADTARNNVHDEYFNLLEENYALKSAVKSCINMDCNMKLPLLVPKGLVRKTEENIVHNL